MTAIGTLAATLPAQARQRLRPDRLKGTIRIACVGDSITWGAGMENREQNNYPTVLQQILGPGYDVRNFGVSGATLLKRGDLPYWDTPAFADSAALRPHAVVIKLGTNDSKPQNWRYRADFPRDAFALVRHYLRLPVVTPLVYLCTPVPVVREAFGIQGTVVAQEIAPTLRRVAQATGVAPVDLFAKLSNAPEYFPDGVHPNATGAAVIAGAVADAFGGLY